MNVTGIMALFVTILLIIIGVFLAPTGFFLGVDPFTLFLDGRSYWLENNYWEQKIKKLIIWFIVQWCTLESTRMYIAILVPALPFFHIYVSCIKLLFTKKLDEVTVRLYNQLYCINQIGIEVLKVEAGVLMASGFSLIALGNWIVVRCFATVTTELCAVIFGILLVIYFVIVETIPFAVMSNDLCENLLRKWNTQVLTNTKEKSYWKKLLRSKRPIAINYATTKFEKDTLVNYYSNIIDCTANMLLLV